MNEMAMIAMILCNKYVNYYYTTNKYLE